MRKSNITAVFNADIETVWNIVTDNSNYSWRSDLSKIEQADDGKTFTEFAKEGFETTFTITVKEPCTHYEFDMNNNNFTGHWIGIFSKTENNGTKIDFAEEIRITIPVMEILSYLFMNLKKMQLTYIRDLKHTLGENN